MQDKKGLDRYTELIWRPFFEDIFTCVVGKKILDAGCGNARYTSQLVDCNDYHGLDKKVTPFVTEVGDAENMPYADGCFEEVIALGLLDYSNPHKTLSEINRVLEMGGTLNIMVPNLYNPYHWVSMLFGVRGKARYSRGELEAHLINHGFVIHDTVVGGFSFYIPGKRLQEAFIPLWIFLDKYLGSSMGMNIFMEAEKIENIQ